MADLKTKLNDGNARDFLNSIEDQKRKEDAFILLDLMKELTGEEPKMWGGTIVGFGSYHYKYESGREGDWFLAGFSPRKQNMSVYIMSGFDKHNDLMNKLGKYKTGKSCLYFKKLEDVNQEVLKDLVVRSVEVVKKRYS